MTLESRYIVHADRVEIVGDRTAQRHRVLTIDDDGDVTIANDAGTVIALLSRAEMDHLVRAHLRATFARAFHH